MSTYSQYTRIMHFVHTHVKLFNSLSYFLFVMFTYIAKWNKLKLHITNRTHSKHQLGNSRKQMYQKYAEV
jgi:hypothetical protein